MGGEKLAFPAILARELGSPPHGRGKGNESAPLSVGYRITPAWAGKRRGMPSRAGRGQDHPRMGGEKFVEYALPKVEAGSPPHGRGKALGTRLITSGTGITPAWAGKSDPALVLLDCNRDHPRMGGEKRTSTQSDKGLTGSPPHGRGKVNLAKREDDRDGITPAWAGKRRRTAPCQATGRDHPRMGGEKLM